MLRSIVPAINLENGSKQLLFKFLPASPSGIYGSLPLPLVLLTTSAKKKTLFAGHSRVFTFLRVELRALLISGPLSRVRKVRSCKVQILIWA